MTCNIMRAALAAISISCIVLACLLSNLPNSFGGTPAKVKNPEDCFRLLNGNVDDCECELTSVADFNNRQLHPLLHSLLRRNFFRYVKVNLKADCPYWKSHGLCATRNCHVVGCGADELPAGIRSPEKCDQPDAGQKLGELDETLSATSKAAFAKWTDHDDSQLQFCEWDDDFGSQSQFVDLLRNPERFTGYRGAPAHKIWRSIYDENCFNRPDANPVLSDQSWEEAALSHCLEIRVYHRLISGLHTSINTHLSHKYLLHDAQELLGQQQWGPNLTEFLVRFHPTFEPQGPMRLRNLHFIFLVELRALAKAEPALRDAKFFTGNSSDDQQLAADIDKLLTIVNDFKGHFDESALFRDRNKEHLKLQIREKFFNITKIMNCVDCDKCRLWGKVQTKGLGTALKILFSPNPPVSLRRHEIVTLFNALGRLSESIRSLEEFKALMRSGVRSEL